MVQPHTNTVERNTQARALLKKAQNEIRKFDAIADAIADSIQNKKGKGALKQCKEMKKCADVMSDLTSKTAANVDKMTPPGHTSYAINRIMMDERRKLEFGDEKENKDDNAPALRPRCFNVMGHDIPMPPKTRKPMMYTAIEACEILKDKRGTA